MQTSSKTLQLELFNYPTFKFEIGQPMWQRLGNDGWEMTEITARTYINGHEVYKTEARDKWVGVTPSLVPMRKLGQPTQLS